MKDKLDVVTPGALHLAYMARYGGRVRISRTLRMRTVRRLPSKLEFAIGGRPAPTEDDHPGGAHPGGAHREGAHREGARGRPPGWQRL